MVIGKRRCCKRKIGVKKILLAVVCCLLTVYIASVIHRAPKSREIWDVVGFKNTTDGICGVQCPYGQVSFYVKTGVENKEGPTVCYQNEVLFSEGKKNGHRGINLVIIDDTTLKVLDNKAYDLYLDDTDFLRDMKVEVKERQIIIAASYDDMSENLKEHGRNWLKIFGAEYIDQVSFRDSYVLIGQKGLKQGSAIEFIERRGSELYARPIEKLGCFTTPMGPVLHVSDAQAHIARSVTVKMGNPLDLCGLEKPCGEAEFPVKVYTGTDSTKFPEICVSGKMVMTKDVNNAGRGINIVVVDPNTQQPKAASRFDTYEKESVNLEIFLENLAHGDIIIAVVFDDGARRFGFRAREMFNQLGSSMSQNLQFRDVWYFVGQKGIDGFTNIEKISYAGMDAEWPKPLQASVCVPTKIKGSPIVPDPPAHRNDARRVFCKSYDGYGEFCDPAHVDEPFIKPIDLIDESQKKNPVYSSPIVIVPGLNENALVKTIETTLMQPGVQLKNVMLVYDEKFPEHGELAALQGLRNVSVPGSTSYQDHMMKAMAEASKLYQSAPYMVVLEEELLLASDFLAFLAQCTQTLEADPSLLGVAAFNYNGHKGVSGNSSLLYRVQEFPGLAFMIKMSAYRTLLQGDFKKCCAERAWYGWSLGPNESVGGEILVPDVSRAFRMSYEGSGPSEEYLTGLFNTPRLTNIESQSKVLGKDVLTRGRYDHWTGTQLLSASVIPTEELRACVTSAGKQPVKLTRTRGLYSVFYKQEDSHDYKALVKLCRCFGVFALDGHKPKNLYYGLLRFTYMDNSVFLVGSSSSFARFKPGATDFFVL